MMNKTKKNFWLDVVIFAAFIAILVTGLATGMGIGHQELGFTLWGLTRPTWVVLHIVSPESTDQFGYPSSMASGLD